MNNYLFFYLVNMKCNYILIFTQKATSLVYVSLIIHMIIYLLADAFLFHLGYKLRN